MYLRCASITSASHLMISVSVSAVRRSTTRSAQEEGLVINIREFIINVTIHNTTVFRSFVRKISVERIWVLGGKQKEVNSHGAIPFSHANVIFFRSVLTKMNAIVREDLITETAVTQVRVKCSSWFSGYIWLQYLDYYDCCDSYSLKNCLYRTYTSWWSLGWLVLMDWVW